MNQLSPKIQKHYQLVGITPGEIELNGKTYDFRTISLSEAHKLYREGCPFLIKQKNDPKTTKKTKT